MINKRIEIGKLPVAIRTLYLYTIGGDNHFLTIRKRETVPQMIDWVLAIVTSLLGHVLGTCG